MHRLFYILAGGPWWVGWTTSNVGCLNSQLSNVLSVGAAGPVTNLPVLRSHITIRSSSFGDSPDPCSCCCITIIFQHHRHVRNSLSERFVAFDSIFSTNRLYRAMVVLNTSLWGRDTQTLSQRDYNTNNAHNTFFNRVFVEINSRLTRGIIRGKY